MEIRVPDLFNYQYCLDYLTRSQNEILHRVNDEVIYKAIPFESEPLSCKITYEQGLLVCEPIEGQLNHKEKSFLKTYIQEWFDLETDLGQFLPSIVDEDPIADIVQRYKGLRIIKVPDLFEALSWAIIGQQINLAFAYNVKSQLIKQFGKKVKHSNIDLYLFPRPQTVLKIKEQEFKAMQFSKQKANYIREAAQWCLSKPNAKDQLCRMQIDEARDLLTAIKGVGSWTANYVLMRCLHFKDAFPIKDVALQRAVGDLYGQGGKPKMDQVVRWTRHWKSWQAYRTFYLWHHLSKKKKSQ